MQRPHSQMPGASSNLGGSLLGALLISACTGNPRTEPACDVVIISIDTVRADALTFEDRKVSPHLCDLAERGVVFDQAIAGSSWTLPSHAELFTGLPPILHGVHDDGRRIDPLHATLGERLGALGMHTAGVFSGWFLAGAYGFGRGFDSYRCALADEPAADQALANALDAGGTAALWARDMRGFASHMDVSSARVVELAQQAILEAPDDQRLALFVHFFDPHHDFIPPSPFDTHFDPDYEGEMTGEGYWNNPSIFDPTLDSGRIVSDRDLQHLRALYQGEIAWVDDRIGDLMATLETAGRMENTLFIVLSDHGEEFFEHGNRGHRQTLYDEVLRVPLLVVPPRSSRSETGPAHSTRQVALCDLLPTIMDYVGSPAPGDCWGSTLRPLVEGRDRPTRAVVSHLGLGAAHGSRAPLRILESYRSEEYKLIRRLQWGTDPLGPQLEAIEWFDLTADPGEKVPIQSGERAQFAETWAIAEAEFEALRRFAAQLPHSPVEELTTDVTRIFEHELAGLGYGGNGLEAPEPENRWPVRPGPALPLPPVLPR
ncbi:MAG: sulfatase-like hydrolase/transferase [Planctomycetota bacterium]|nr:sulfatase-like hydrolase/transferase [Planctomycetota bacterium]MDP6738893.1 sulfatase-like hydrolase/transferase [Planctomycetota bacterium]MDP6939913.1 sulfatase-like hydrolase/transferase [Planctomycetota bacterium]